MHTSQQPLGIAFIGVPLLWWRYTHTGRDVVSFLINNETLTWSRCHMFEPDMIIFSPDVAQDNLLKYRPITDCTNYGLQRKYGLKYSMYWVEFFFCSYFFSFQLMVNKSSLWRMLSQYHLFQTNMSISISILSISSNVTHTSLGWLNNRHLFCPYFPPLT